MDVKEFLREPNIQEALQRNDLKYVYRCASNECMDLTKFLLEIGIDPLNYIDIVFGNMYEGINISDIILPENIISIADYGFSWCKELRNITIPESVKFIGEYAFQGCQKLEKITIPSSVSTIFDGTFMGCTNLKEVIIEPGVTGIADDAFRECKNLYKISLPTTLTQLSSDAFYLVNLYNKEVHYNGKIYDSLLEFESAFVKNGGIII